MSPLIIWAIFFGDVFKDDTASASASTTYFLIHTGIVMGVFFCCFVYDSVRAPGKLQAATHEWKQQSPEIRDAMCLLRDKNEQRTNEWVRV